MLFGESALARHSGHHRDLRQFGKLDQIFSSIGVHYPLPRMYDRVGGVHQGFGGCLYSGRVACCRCGLDRTITIHDAVWHLSSRHICRNLDHYGAGPAAFEGGECAAHRVYYTFRNINLLDLFRH